MSALYYITLIIIFLLLFFKLPSSVKYEKLKHLSLWVIIILFFVFIYSFKNNVKSYIGNNSFLAYLIPGNGYKEGEVIRFKKSLDGHFYITIKINGVHIKFLVDTGATDTVISMVDATRMGINIQALNYTSAYNTANGTIYAAPITLEQISLYGKTVNNIKVAVSHSKMDSSLLGMSFLERFHFTIEGDTLSIK